MKLCSKCGAENKKNADFCSLCLTPFTKKKTVKKKHKTALEKKEEQIKKELQKQNQEIKRPTPALNIVDLLSIPLIAAAGAFLLTIAIPKDPVFFSGNPIVYILLAAASGGWVVVSNYKPIDAKRLLSGFLIGISAIFIGYILTFMFWMILLRTSTTAFSRFSFGSENLVLPIVLALGIAVFDQIEKFEIKRFFVISAVCLISAFIAITVSKAIPVIHSFVIVGFVCWIFIPLVKVYLPD